MEGAGPSLRRARPDDAEALSRFARSAFIDAFGDQNDPDDLAQYLAGAFSTDRQATELADPARRCLLVETSARLIGYALLRNAAPHAEVTASHPVELERFYIERAWHGRGVAAVLMDQVIDEARALSGDVLWLGVWERNPRAIRFYEKQGFEAVGAHRFMLGSDPQTDRVLRRVLRG